MTSAYLSGLSLTGESTIGYVSYSHRIATSLPLHPQSIILKNKGLGSQLIGFLATVLNYV